MNASTEARLERIGHRFSVAVALFLLGIGLAVVIAIAMLIIGFCLWALQQIGMLP